MPFSVQNDQGGGAGIFACVIMVEFQVQRPFEVRKAVATVTLQFCLLYTSRCV